MPAGPTLTAASNKLDGLASMLMADKTRYTVGLAIVLSPV
jgi:hypothetical protein